MSRFVPGQRIKKVRGERGLGTTGRFVCDELYPDGDFDCWIKCDSAWMGALDILNPPEQEAFCVSSQWEPIIPPQTACDEDFRRDLDRVLQREGVSA
jgi:hypothetical protein